MSVVVTPRPTRKTSPSLYIIVPRYTVTAPSLNEALADASGNWRLLEVVYAFGVPRETCPTDPSVGPGREQSAEQADSLHQPC